MSFGAGSLTIAARRTGPRTVIERVRYEGISRCSRAFAHGGAALVVLSQLGPGVVRGDRVRTHGRVGPDAHLIVTNQTATRVMGGALEAHAEAAWTLEAGAVLEVIGQPLLAAENARYTASTAIDLAPDACAIVSDSTHVPASARVVVRTSIRQGGRERFYDAVDAGASAPRAVGTLVVVGLPDTRVAATIAALDAAADASRGLHIGVGALPHGAFVRILADDVWPVRCTLEALHATVRALLAPRSSA